MFITRSGILTINTWGHPLLQYQFSFLEIYILEILKSNNLALIIKLSSLEASAGWAKLRQPIDRLALLTLGKTNF